MHPTWGKWHPFLFLPSLSLWERDLQNYRPTLPHLFPFLPIYRAAHSFFISPPVSLYDANGMPVMRPQRCDAADPAHGIVGALRVEECRCAALVLKRLWTH